MTDEPALSILIPCLPSRIIPFGLPLLAKLERMAEGKPVEILALLDNKKRSIGLKRDALVQAARGEYLAFVDDDDDVADSYVDALLDATETLPDVIVFTQQSSIDGERFLVHHGIEFENEAAYKNAEGQWADIRRKPWHHCAWRTKLAQRYHFPDRSYGEDWEWCEQVLQDVVTQKRIDATLHFYNFRSHVTEAC